MAETTTLYVEKNYTEDSDVPFDMTTELNNFTSSVGGVRESTWTVYVAYIITPVVMVVGIFGNASVVIIMRSKHFRTTTAAVFLTALAISDTKYILMFPFNKSTMQEIFGRDLRAVTEAGCKAFFCIFRTAKIFSAWVIVSICVERFYVIWFPLHAKSIATQRNAKIVVFCLLVAVYTFDGIWTITTTVVNGVCLPNYPSAKNKALSGAFVLTGLTIYDVVPSITLISLTPLTIYKLLKQRTMRRRLGRTHRNDETYRITRMLVAVTVAYIVLATPIGAAHCVAFFSGDNIFESDNPDFIIFSEIAQICEHLNAVVNFLVFVNYNSTFRRHFCRILIFCNGSPVQEFQDVKENQVSSGKTTTSSQSNSLDVSHM